MYVFSDIANISCVYSPRELVRTAKSEDLICGHAWKYVYVCMVFPEKFAVVNLYILITIFDTLKNFM